MRFCSFWSKWPKLTKNFLIYCTKTINTFHSRTYFHITWSQQNWRTLGKTEEERHICFKELLTADYFLRSFKDCFNDKHVKIFSDSQTGIMLISKMKANKSSQNNLIVKDIWQFCSSNNIRLTTAQICFSIFVLVSLVARYKDMCRSGNISSTEVTNLTILQQFSINVRRQTLHNGST